MTTESLSNTRYNNTSINLLVQQLHSRATEYESHRQISIRKQRKNHLSCCQIMERNRFKQKAPFNNKTHNESKLFEPNLKSVPYMFMSKHKQDNLIIPDRAFAKGNAAKRFFIKMKDSSVYSFKQAEDKQISCKLQKEQKQKTIISRKLEQWERIVDQDDGKIKAKNNKWFLMNRKTFRPTSNISDMFSRVDPVLEPFQEGLNIQMKKLSLTGTFSRTKWRPATQFRSSVHSATVGTSMFGRTEDLQKKSFS